MNYICIMEYEVNTVNNGELLHILNVESGSCYAEAKSNIDISTIEG